MFREDGSLFPAFVLNGGDQIRVHKIVGFRGLFFQGKTKKGGKTPVISFLWPLIVGGERKAQNPPFIWPPHPTGSVGSGVFTSSLAPFPLPLKKKKAARSNLGK